MIYTDADSDIADDGGSAAANHGSGAAAAKASAVRSTDGLPCLPVREEDSGAAAGGVAVPGPASAAATPSRPPPQRGRMAQRPPAAKAPLPTNWTDGPFITAAIRGSSTARTKHHGQSFRPMRG
jgi:hypothetical protein